jgi:hypothetical protein
MLLTGIISTLLIGFRLNRQFLSRLEPIKMAGIADKMVGVIEFLSGQNTITEKNIEATLKVSSLSLKHSNDYKRFPL